jgi:hypothetical protein
VSWHLPHAPRLPSYALRSAQACTCCALLTAPRQQPSLVCACGALT